jgi:hypothetical protein
MYHVATLLKKVLHVFSTTRKKWFSTFAKMTFHSIASLSATTTRNTSERGLPLRDKVHI